MILFSAARPQALAVELEQSPFLSLISDQRIQQIMPMMNQPNDARLTPEISRDLCQRAGSAAVLTGVITQIGAWYLLTLEAVNCTTGQSLASAAAQASDKNQVLDALASASSEMTALASFCRVFERPEAAQLEAAAKALS